MRERVGPPATGAATDHARHPDYRWSLHLTVEAASESDARAVADRSGTVAIDLGWRVRPVGTRVGYWGDDAGKHDELIAPESIREDLKFVASLRAIRDRNFDAFREQLATWLDEHEVPAWLVAETAALRLWKSPDRLAALVDRWRTARFDGDAAIFATSDACERKPRERDGAMILHCVQHAECWHHRDRHVARHAMHRHATILRQRDELYRVWAATFARTYRTVVVERFNILDVAGRRSLGASASDAEKVKADRASSVRHVAAPGTFRLALKNACTSRGTLYVEKAAAYTTLACWRCGHAEPWDAAPSIDHCCASCGATWDQDYNATVNLRASDEVVPPTGRALAGGKSARQQRFAKRRGKSAEVPTPSDGDYSRDGAEALGTAGNLPRAVAIPAQEGVS